MKQALVGEFSKDQSCEDGAAQGVIDDGVSYLGYLCDARCGTLPLRPARKVDSIHALTKMGPRFSVACYHLANADTGGHAISGPQCKKSMQVPKIVSRYRRWAEGEQTTEMQVPASMRRRNTRIGGGELA